MSTQYDAGGPKAPEDDGSGDWPERAALRMPPLSEEAIAYVSDLLNALAVAEHARGGVR
jgi:hypothetical protein